MDTMRLLTHITTMMLLLLGIFSSAALATDLDIRFSKVFVDEAYYTQAVDLPLTAAHYPLQATTFRWLRYSSAYSVMLPDVCMECDWDFEELVDTMGGPPTHVSSNETDPYWDELAHVVEMQRLRQEGVEPSTIMPLPDLWKNLSIEQVAENVHNEYPGIHHVALITEMDKAKAIETDYNVIPYVSNVEFVRGLVMLADLATWAIARVGPSNFGVKYFVGRARPEEVAYKIDQGEITVGPPPDLVDAIKALNLTSAESFTAYPEGSPMHPSWPAMHSASSASSLWLAVVLDLTPKQWCQVKLTDYAVSYARTVAGVHYVSDNIAGLELGQEIVARRLPDYLNAKYGSSKSRVEKKINAVRFEWKDFLESDCALGLV